MRDTLRSLIERDAVEIEYVMSGTAPASYPPGSNSYKVTLHRQGKELVTPFHTGPASTDDPTAEGVLSCLLSDASAGAMSFEEFCDEFGHDNDPDSRPSEAYATWQACVAAESNVREFLGDDFKTYLHAGRD